jgi:hypothetical protein
MITERQYIKDNLYDVFFAILTAQGIADIPIIYDNENGKRPKAPFLMIEFRSTVSPGMPDYSKVKMEDGTYKQRISHHTRRNMTMYGFGERAIDVLETIKSQLNVGDWDDELRKRKLTIPQVMETVESPQSFETTRENGASFDFDLTYIRVIETEPGYIEDVGLNPSFAR